MSAKLRQPLGFRGHPYQGALPLDGAVVERLTVGASWTEIDPAGRDLVVLRVPAGTRQVVLAVSDSATDRAGVAATVGDMASAFALDAGVYEFCTDRDGESFDRYWLAVDPTDTTAGVATTATVQILKAGSR